MARLRLNRRQKTKADKKYCIPAGDVLPIWKTISLDAKVPMMSHPKGSIVLFTTKLGEPKHLCKQKNDFDLRDPNGQYNSDEYNPLNDPYLKSHFNTNSMRRHLIKKGLISEDGKVICPLKEFNQYRQYLRHTYVMEVANERKEEHEKKLGHVHDKSKVQRKVSHGIVVRKRCQQKKERDMNRLKKHIVKKTTNLESRLKEIRDEMTQRESKKREEAERRRFAILKHQQEKAQQEALAKKRCHKSDQKERRLVEDRESQRKNKAELKCMSKWNDRKDAQKKMLKTFDECLKETDAERAQNISKREQEATKTWNRIEKKLEKTKQKSWEEKEKKNYRYIKRLNKKLSSEDSRIKSRRNGCFNG